MNKRILKKRHLPPFTAWGFEVRATVDDKLTKDEQYTVEDTICYMLDGLNLSYGGGFDLGMFICKWIPGKRGTRGHGVALTETDRSIVENKLKTIPGVTSFTVGPLVDGWYPGEDD